MAEKKTGEKVKIYEVIFEVDEHSEGMILNSWSYDVVESIKAKNEIEAREEALKKFPKEWTLKGICEKSIFTQMKKRWMKFWAGVETRSQVPEIISSEIYHQLVSLYCEPHRAYHNLNHIAHCLDELGQAVHLVKYSKEVEMAIWFHDAIYNPQAKDNEKKSAELADQIVRWDTAEPESFGRNVSSLVLATKHQVVPEDIDAQVLVDIDLSVLGRSVKEFDEYERKIRKEFSWLSDDQFRIERCAFLQALMNRPTIYATDFFRQKYEAQARRNLERSLGILTIN